MEEIVGRGGLERSLNTDNVENGSGLWATARVSERGVDTQRGYKTKLSVAAGGIISYMNTVDASCSADVDYTPEEKPPCNEKRLQHKLGSAIVY